MEELLGGDDRLDERLGDAGDAPQRVLDPGLLGGELGLVGEILEAAAAAGRVVDARRLDPLRAGLEHLGRDRLGVPALNLRHAGAHGVAGKAGADEDDEAVEPRDAVPAEGERVDRELELLVTLYGGGHPASLDGERREPSSGRGCPKASTRDRTTVEQPVQNRHTAARCCLIRLDVEGGGKLPHPGRG